MTLPIIPPQSPFSEAQRQWLNGLFAQAPAHAPGTPSAVAVHGIASPAPGAPSAPGIESPAAPIKARELVPAYDRLNPFPATILEIRPLTGKDSVKDVRAVSFDLGGSGLRYETGDALGVYPENCPELVDELLEILCATGEEPVATPEGFVVPARLALLKAYVITQHSHDFLAHLAHCAADPTEASRLAELAEDDPEEFLDGLDIIDLLRHFPSTLPDSRMAIAELIGALPPLRARLYSIASSQAAYPDQVHLTVGVVRYERHQRQRKGVASTFLSERIRPGHRVGVFVHESPNFRLPHTPETPVIMVGPGTGIAPFRAFLQERQATNSPGKNWLFFGDQRRDCDFLYQKELEAYQDSGLLTHLDTAFSRDQPHKIYVQNRMLEAGDRLWGWLQEGAHVYVCGDAKRMARDVDVALHKIAREHGNLDETGAKAYIAGLARAKRYQRDVY